MNAQDVAALAAQIRATVRAEVMREMQQFLSSRDEDRLELESLTGRITNLEAATEAGAKRIEEVASTPNVHVHPPVTVEAPAIHFAPTIQVPARKPTKKTFTKQPDGSFRIEEIE